jgi:hypothetical protein
VHLLDDYLAATYGPPQRFGVYAVSLRTGNRAAAQCSTS